MIASQPRSSSQRASATVVADAMTRQPAALTRASNAGAGKPKWKLTTSGLASSTTLHMSSPNGGRSTRVGGGSAVDPEFAIVG